MEDDPSECYKSNPRRGLARVSAYQLAEYVSNRTKQKY